MCNDVLYLPSSWQRRPSFGGIGRKGHDVPHEEAVEDEGVAHGPTCICLELVYLPERKPTVQGFGKFLGMNSLSPVSVLTAVWRKDV
jgi:hypothetical protein